MALEGKTNPLDVGSESVEVEAVDGGCIAVENAAHVRVRRAPSSRRRVQAGTLAAVWGKIDSKWG